MGKVLRSRVRAELGFLVSNVGDVATGALVPRACNANSSGNSNGTSTDHSTDNRDDKRTDSNSDNSNDNSGDKNTEVGLHGSQ